MEVILKMKKVISTSLLILAWLSLCACDGRSHTGPFTGEMRNKTKHDLVEVRVVGRGYPGSFGYLVAGGVASQGYSLGDVVDEQFTVEWKIENGPLQTQTLRRPFDFGKDRERVLVVEFTGAEKITAKAYTELAPWVR